jgi:hypothetical protein
MKTLKIVLLVVLLLSVVIVAGCQEGFARQDNLAKWEPTGTGFWRPVVTPVEAK